MTRPVGYDSTQCKRKEIKWPKFLQGAVSSPISRLFPEVFRRGSLLGRGRSPSKTTHFAVNRRRGEIGIALGLLLVEASAGAA
jgi:hypothetical protein